MPIIAHAGGVTFSGRFDFELLLLLEGETQAVAAIEAELASAGVIGRPGPDAAQAGAPFRLCRIEPAGDLPATLAHLLDRLADAAVPLGRFRSRGGRCAGRVICKVDFNADFALEPSLLRRLGSLGVDLAVHMLDAETPATAEGMRRFLAAMNDPPWDRSPPEAEPDEPS